MEYSLNTAASLGDIEFMVHRFINDSIKRSQSGVSATNSNTLNQQHLSDVIERFIGIANTPSTVNLLIEQQQGRHRLGAINAGDAATSTAVVTTPSTPTSLKMEELGHVYDDDVAETKAKGARKIHCSECPRILLSRKNFIKHAEDEHGMILPIIHKSFDDQRDFDKWMAYLREERQTEFVSKCGRKRLSNGSLLGYLVCSKGGCGGEINNRKKTAKSLKTCAAYLKVLRNELSGKIDVEGCVEHTGHDLGSGCSATGFNHNNNNVESTTAPTFVVVHRETPTVSVDTRNEPTKYLEATQPASTASAGSTIDALDAFGTTLYGSGGLLDTTALSSRLSSSIGAAPSSSAYTRTVATAPISGRAMLPAEILCNFLNAVKQISVPDADPIANFLPQLFASTIPNAAVEQSQNCQLNFASYSNHNAPTPPGEISTFSSMKREDDEMVATSSSDQLATAPATPEPSVSRPHYSDVRSMDALVERRKLALIEHFQTAIQKVDKSTIDGAEVAMRFFVRELEGLSSKGSML